jgi:hypothetical protein
MPLVTIGPSPAPEQAISPFASATANIQAAARWIVAALAAVGGVLVSSVPLTGLGKFNSFLEFSEAGAGLLVALAAVGFTIAAAARVFTTEHITLAALAAKELPTKAGGGPEPIEQTIRQIMRSREELFGEVAKDLGDLNAQLASANKALRNDSSHIVSEAGSATHALMSSNKPYVRSLLGDAWLRPQRRATPTPATETELSPLAARLQSSARTVVDFANYDTARRNFSSLTVRLLAAGFIAIIGVSDYAYWISRPELQVGQPTPVLVSLPPSTPAGFLGFKCDLGRVSAVAISGTIERPTVVTVPTDQCAARRFTVPPGAVVIPVRDLPSP